jgi:hypothetical protein
VQTRKNFYRGAAAPHPAISPVFPAQHQIAALIEILTLQQAVDKEVVLGNGTRHAWANFSNIKQILD